MVLTLAALATLDTGSRARLGALLGNVAAFATVLASVLVDTRLLAVTQAVALATVEASDGVLDILALLLLAVSGGMADLLAIVALREATGHHLSSLSEAGKVLLVVLGPLLSLAGAGRLVAQAIGDGELLAEVALQVHVGHGRKHILSLVDADEVEANLLGTQELLDLRVRGRGQSLEVHLHSSLGIVDLAVGHGLSDQLQRLLRGGVRNAAAVDLASGSAVDGLMT